MTQFLQCSHFFQIRMFLGNCGLTIAIGIMLLIDSGVLAGGGETGNLSLTFGLTPTKTKRGWGFTPFPVSSAALPLLTIVAGFLFYLIIFIEAEAAQ